MRARPGSASYVLMSFRGIWQVRCHFVRKSQMSAHQALRMLNNGVSEMNLSAPGNRSSHQREINEKTQTTNAQCQAA